MAFTQSTHGLTVAAGGTPIAGLGLTVYDLNGRTVFHRETSGTTLSWNYLSSEGQPVANGVYLYTVTIKGQDGQVYTTGVKRIVVLR